MGLYNSVYVHCPDCGTRHEFQSKRGSCSMASFTLADAPIADLLGIEDDVINCQCGRLLVIAVKVTASVLDHIPEGFTP